MKIRITKAVDEARRMEYEGVVTWVRFGSLVGAKMHKRAAELAAIDGLDDAAYLKLDDEAQTRYQRRAYIGTIVESIEPFELTEGGETVTLRMDDPIDAEGYETVGEYLVGTDDGYHSALQAFAFTKANFAREVEIRSLGNSKLPSDSGGSSASVISAS